MSTHTTYDNTNKGALFKNADKNGEKDPDYRGELNVGGANYWISGWVSTSKKGAKYLAIKLRPKEKAAKPKPEIEDAIPF